MKTGDYIIKLIKNKNPFYGPIYNFFTKKLEELYSYLDNTLKNKYIQYSVSLIKAFIFFVLKKDNNLYFYINYHKLNKIIIKNYYFLPLITEIFNWLYNIKKFTKLNLKNAYYCIYIKEKNK